MENLTRKKWKRVIALVDFDAFFAAIEQRDDETLRGKPIGIVNGEAGTTLITTSYEARQYGIKTSKSRSSNWANHFGRS